MAVVEDVLLEAPPASPELALVDPELAAELRRAHSPVDDHWLRPPASVEDSSAENEDPVQLVVDAGYAKSHDTQRVLDDEFIVATPPEQTPAEELRPSSHSSIIPAPEPDEAAFKASVGIDKDDTALPGVAEVLREAEAVGVRVLVDESLTTTSDQTPSEDAARSHYPLLPASESDANDATDAALRRIREGLTAVAESPSRKRRFRRG